MKIELQVKGKEVSTPKFDIYLDDSGVYVFLILEDLTEKEQKEINSDISNILFEENNLILEISDKYFIFNLDDFEGFKNTKNSLAFMFYDKNHKLINKNCRVFSFIINN